MKFAQSENENSLIDRELKKFIKNKKTWCASSTHKSEELFCGLVHLDLKKKYKSLLTIIIPRHIERVREIKNELEKLKLNDASLNFEKKISPDADIYLVNSYGKTKSFYDNCKNIFLGGSLIKHGGQNPLEAVRYGCHVLYGPNIWNFKEIYDLSKKKKYFNNI